MTWDQVMTLRPGTKLLMTEQGGRQLRVPQPRTVRGIDRTLEVVCWEPIGTGPADRRSFEDIPRGWRSGTCAYVLAGLKGANT